MATEDLVVNRVVSSTTATPGRALNQVRNHQLVIDEPTHLVGAAQQRPPALPFGRHFLGPDRVLGEAGARASLALLGIAPARLHYGGRRGEQGQIG